MLFGKEPPSLLKAEKETREVDAQDVFPLGWRDADGEAIDRLTHRPNKGIESTPSHLNLFEQDMDMAGIAHVRLKRFAPSTKLGYFLKRVGNRRMIGVVMDAHVPSILCESKANRGTNDAGSSKNKHRWGRRFSGLV